MEQTINQNFTSVRHRTKLYFDQIIEDPVIGFSVIVILGFIWLIFQFKDYLKHDRHQKQPLRSQIKSEVRNFERAEYSQKEIDPITAQKQRLSRMLRHQSIKERQNPSNKLNFGSKEFFNKKSIVQSLIRNPKSKLLVWNNKDLEDQENQNFVKQQFQKNVKKLGSQTELPEPQNQLNRNPSFNNLNFSSNNSINLDGPTDKQKDRVIQNVSLTKMDLFSNKPLEINKDKVPQKIDQTKPAQQQSGIFKQTTVSGSLFGSNNQTSLFSQQPKLVQQAKSTNQTNANTGNTAQPQTSLSMPVPDSSLFNIANKNIQNATQPSLFNPPSNLKLPEVTKTQQISALIHKPVPITAPVIKPNTVNPRPAARLNQKLSSQDLLQGYLNFVQNLKEEIPITTKVQSLMGGARSSPNVILVQAKALLATIDKNDDKQITTFALKLFQTIVFNFINNSNIKSGLERIPLRQRTKQCQKNAINAYILTLNMYRLMNPGKKIWAIVFGKILKMMSFLFKRKQDLKDFHHLQLIQCNYIKKFKEVHSKYVSRIDFLMYFLLGMTAFDPLLILKQVQAKQREVQTARMQVQSWGNQWSYSEFWSLVHAILSNKHQSYSKPIFFMNLLYVLYPRIFQHKINTALFKKQNELFLIVLGRAKNYLKGYNKMKQIKILSDTFENEQYEYDGADLVKSIQVLDSRISQKQLEIKMNAKDFEAKANIFYYFTKQK